VRCLVKRLQRIDKEMAGEARQEFAAFIPDGDVAAFATALPKALRQDFSKTMKLLRAPNFQDLLVHYKRKPRYFYISEGTQDTVSSEWLVRGADGQEYKPEDYLKAFAQFVREHESDIEAIRVLLRTPHRWNPDALQQLRQ
jgi:type I restriction enzyme R subunit